MFPFPLTSIFSTHPVLPFLISTNFSFHFSLICNMCIGGLVITLQKRIGGLVITRLKFSA